MYQLQSYRPSGTPSFLRRMKSRSPASILSGTLVVAAWISIFFFGFMRLDGGFSIFILFAVLVASTIAIPFAVNFGWQALVNTRLGKPELSVNTSRIQRGTELQCEFVQPVKGRVAINDARIQLIAQEWVKYTEGTSTYTKTHDNVIDEIIFDGQQKNTGEEIWLQANFRIPGHVTHNFNFSNNRLQWLLIVKVTIPAWPGFYEEYALEFPADVQ